MSLRHCNGSVTRRPRVNGADGSTDDESERAAAARGNGAGSRPADCGGQGGRAAEAEPASGASGLEALPGARGRGAVARVAGQTLEPRDRGDGEADGVDAVPAEVRGLRPDAGQREAEGARRAEREAGDAVAVA